MSVSLYVKYSGGTTKLIPVAAQDLFIKYWIPTASHLDLKLVPLFITGLDIDHENIPRIIAELGKVQRYIHEEKHIDLPAEIRDIMERRITVLISGLEGLANESFIEAYF